MVFLGLAFPRLGISADPQRTRWDGLSGMAIPYSLERANLIGNGYGEARGSFTSRPARGNASIAVVAYRTEPAINIDWAFRNCSGNRSRARLRCPETSAFRHTLPVEECLNGQRGAAPRSFWSASGVPGLTGLVATLFWGLVSIPVRGPSSNSQRVGGNIRDTGGVYVAIQRRHLSFTSDAQQLAEKFQLIISKRAEIQCIQDLLLHRPTIRPRHLDPVGVYPARRCPRSITKAEGHDLRAAGLALGHG